MKIRPLSTIKNLLWVGLSSLCFYSAAPVADVSATVGIASIYLDRGLDLADGEAEIYGDLNYEHGSGLYASVWGSSLGAGDASHEYDLIMGWNHAFNELNINLGFATYLYPGHVEDSKVFDETEVYLGLSWKGLALYVYDNVASEHDDNEGYYYLALSYTHKNLSATLGYATDDDMPSSSFEEGEYSYAHIDMIYAYSANLSFTFSKIVDRSAKINGASINESQYEILAQSDDRFEVLLEDDLLFVVTYDLPLEF